jgi:serine/threonine protein kinase
LASSLKDNLTSEIVAIKKIPGPFRTEEAAKRTFREVKLLNHLRHDNVRAARMKIGDNILIPQAGDYLARYIRLLS